MVRNGHFQTLGNNLISALFIRRKMYIAFHSTAPHLGRESGPEKRAHQHIRRQVQPNLLQHRL